MKNQNGFTLIEITLVLVLIGILAAVAAQKYFDMQEAAEKQAAKATVAEAQARINATFGEALLSGSTCSDAVASAKNALSSDFGEYTLTVASWDEEGKGLPEIKKGNDSIPNTDAYLILPQCDSSNSALTGLFTQKYIDYIYQAAINGDMYWQLNSEYTGPKSVIKNFENYIKDNSGSSLGDLGVSAWAYNANDKNNKESGGYFFWTSESITNADVGKSIDVIVYNTQDKSYTVATATIQNGGTNTPVYLSLTGSSQTSVKNTIASKEVDAMKNSSHTADEAYAVYKNMNKKPY